MVVISFWAVMVQLMAASLASGNPVLVEERGIDCANPKVQSFVSTAHSRASKLIDPFCSTYLGYKPAKTKTVTEKNTWEEPYYVFVTTGTVTYITDTVVTTSGTTTVSRTIGVFATPTPTVNRREAKPEPAPALPERPVKTDAGGKLFGFASKVVSSACSCLVTSPTPTTTTSYKWKTKAVTVTETIPQFTVTSTITYTDIKYSWVSIVSTKTYQRPTSCGSSASPTFFVQMRDADPANKDQWDGNYLAMMESVWRSTELSPDAIALPEASKNRAVLVTIEPGTNYLKSVSEGWYLNSDPYNDFQLMFFNKKADIDIRQYNYHKCSIVQSGSEKELKCSVPDNPWGLKVYQTCPLYMEYFGTPMVAGADFSPTAPACREKKFFVVDACSW